MLENLKNVLRRCESGLLRFKRIKDVLFVVDNELMLRYARSVSDLLETDERIRVWYCFIHRKNFLDFKKVTRERKRTRGVPYSLARWLRWDLILYPAHGPYFRHQSPKIYIGHGLSSGKKINGKHYMFSNNSLSISGQVIYDKMFISSDFIRDQVQESFPEFYSATRVVGNLWLDDVVAPDPDREEMCQRYGLDPRRKTVLIASSWGPYSLIQSQGKELSEILPRLCQDVNVVLSLHPNNFKQVHYQGLDIQGMLSRLDRLSGLHIMPPDVAGEQYLSWVDMMVSDVTSLGLYFPLFDKPMLFYDHHDLPLTDSGLIRELKKTVPNFRDVSQLPHLVAQTIEQFHTREHHDLKIKISSCVGQARQKYLNEIYDSLKLDQTHEGDTCEHEDLSIIPKFSPR